MINPGTRPVPDASLPAADANIAAFVDELQQMGAPVVAAERDTAADADGRFGYLLRYGGDTTVRIRMPGVPIERVTSLAATAPCLYVNGLAWWWRSALFMAAGAVPSRPNEPR